MKRFVEGEDRTQGVLLPEFLDDYVTEDNPVRVVDVFIDELDLEALGFSGVAPEVSQKSATLRSGGGRPLTMRSEKN
jgi:transposase